MQQGPLTAETHTGMVFLVGDRAYKVKKPVVTDFLDFSTLESRERACAHELELNSRLAPDSYLGIGHFTPPGGGPGEPVLVMRRHPDERRLATMVRRGDEVEPELGTIALVLARFHASAARGREVDAEARVDAITARWAENLAELKRYADGVVPGLEPDAVAETARLATDFIAGRAVLFSAATRLSALIAGRPVLAASVREPRAVRRGDQVLIAFSGDGIDLTAPGRALQDGILGDQVRVVNLASNRTITAAVAGSGRVTVE